MANARRLSTHDVDRYKILHGIFIGHPLGAINVPWIDELEWKINPNFVPGVQKVMLGGLASEVQETSKILISNGLCNVYHVTEVSKGDLDHEHHRSTLSGWRFYGLSW